jgi:hypothetical protein
MSNLVRAACLAVLVLAPLQAAAQSQPGVGTPVDPGKPSLLDQATQERVRKQMQSAGVASVTLPEAKVGATVPADATLYALPEDVVTEIPTVTRYRFALAGDRILVVDPVTRGVVQLIDR